MSKWWIINTLESTKKKYIVDAYSEEEAIKLIHSQLPHEVSVLGEQIYEIESINLYEYETVYKSDNTQMAINWSEH
mgnify:CR=1 FL=1